MVISDFASKFGFSSANASLTNSSSFPRFSKAIEGELNGLRDKNILNSIEEKETNLKSLVSQNAELKKEFGEIWNRIDSVQKKMIVRHKEFYYRSASNSKLVNIALKIVRYATEIQKPNEKQIE